MLKWLMPQRNKMESMQKTSLGWFFLCLKLSLRIFNEIGGGRRVTVNLDGFLPQGE